MECGQSQFAPLKLRSLALVPSSGARCAPANSSHGRSTARFFPPRYGALVRNLRPLRIRIVNFRGTGYKLIAE